MFAGKALALEARLGTLLAPTTRAGYSKYPRECPKPLHHNNTGGKGQGNNTWLLARPLPADTAPQMGTVYELQRQVFFPTNLWE